jgi:excisionase family DNA binding protein
VSGGCELERALLLTIAGAEAEDALAALAACLSRLQTQLLREQVQVSAYANAPKRLLRAEEVAKLLAVSVKTVYERKHELGFTRIGRAVRFNAEDVQRAVEDGL